MIDSFSFTHTSPDTAELNIQVTEENLPEVLAQLRELGIDIDENMIGIEPTRGCLGYDDDGQSED